MANIENSPFNRSAKTARSPPCTPQPPHHAADNTYQALTSSDIQHWLTSIEKHLNEVCQIAADGKLNTEQKLKINKLAQKVGSGVSQMAMEYQSLKQNAIAVNISLEALKEKQALADCFIDLKKTILDTIEGSCKPNENVSFADMVKTNKNNFVRPKNDSCVAIYPTDKLKTSEETKLLVQTIICPEQMKLHVRGVRKTRNGGVIINTETKGDIEKLKQSTQLSKSGLTIEEPNKRKPRIIVVGVPAALHDQEVFDCIYKQNLADKLPNCTRESFLSSIKLSHKSGKKEATTCNYILEVSASIRKALIQQERAYINWTSCPVYDFTLVTRCYKCHQYGHAAKTCREPVSTCGHCGELGHQASDCNRKGESPKCASCARYKKPNGHKTGDPECPAKKMAEARYISSIDYNKDT